MVTKNQTGKIFDLLNDVDKKITKLDQWKEDFAPQYMGTHKLAIANSKEINDLKIKIARYIGIAVGVSSVVNFIAYIMVQRIFG